MQRPEAHFAERAVPVNKEYAVIDQMRSFFGDDAVSPERGERSGGLSLGFHYLEADPSVTGDEYEHFLTIDEANALEYLRHVAPEVVPWLTKQPRDERLWRALRDFVGKTVNYVRDTGEMLDLAGAGKAVLIRDAERWRLVLPNARYPERGRWDDARAAMDVYLKSGHLSWPETDYVVNAMNFERFINAVAILIGASDRLSISKESLAGKGPALLAKIRDAHRQ